jgi:hypothetical protein
MHFDTLLHHSDEGAAPPTVYMSDDDKDSESDQEVDNETKNTEEYKVRNLCGYVDSCRSDMAITCMTLGNLIFQSLGLKLA